MFGTRKKGFMWPKDAEGKWIEPFDPKFGGGQGGRAYYDENNAYTYNWDVLHDFGGLFELMGGAQGGGSATGQLFREGLDRSKYEYLGEVPGLHRAGRPVRDGATNQVQHAVSLQPRRRAVENAEADSHLLDAFYNDDIHGIPGDEDGGGMTAWVVFSMMGFYPVTPGVPVYDLGSPVFKRVTIRLRERQDLHLIAKDRFRRRTNTFRA